uniref:Uncharacterized protein n=1 Tax=Heterorhabditis bacteriophora TaxID=37862 RepID=A0A1I7W6K2_HETBA
MMTLFPIVYVLFSGSHLIKIKDYF